LTLGFTKFYSSCVVVAIEHGLEFSPAYRRRIEKLTDWECRATMGKLFPTRSYVRMISAMHSASFSGVQIRMSISALRHFFAVDLLYSGRAS